MKTLFSILLSFLLLAGSFFPKNDIDEFYKIPALLRHYSEHLKNSSARFNLMDFLVLHYFSDHKDPLSHENLPLMNHHCPGLVFLLPVLPSLKKVSPAVEIKYHLSDLNDFVSPVQDSRFQPPKGNNS